MVEGGELCLRSLRNSENRSTITSAPFPTISNQRTLPNTTKILDWCYFGRLAWVVAGVMSCLIFAVSALSQTVKPTPEPSPLPKDTRIKTFGSSLEKFEKKKKQNAPSIRNSDNPVDDEIIRVDTDLVVTDVLVTDQKGNVITGLKKDDFIVIENGTSQGIEVFSSAERSTVPRSIILVIDCGLLQAPYLQMSIEAAKNMVDKLDPQDKMAIATVDVKLHLDFSADKILLKSTLDYLGKKGLDDVLKYNRGQFDEPERARGWQFDTLMAVLNELYDEPGRQRIVLFQTDGAAVIWLKPDKDLPYPVSDTTRLNSGMKYTGRDKAMSKFGFSEVKEAIEVSRTSIYSIITGIRFFGLPEKERKESARISWENMGKAHGWKDDYPSDVKRMFEEREERVRTSGQAAMYRVSELSGGNTAVMEKPEDAERIYSDIFAVIQNRYVIGYYPVDVKPGEKLRNVKFEVRDHPEYMITGRKTYILK